MGRMRSQSRNSLLVEAPWLAVPALAGALPILYPQWFLLWLVGIPVSAIWGLFKLRDRRWVAGLCYIFLALFWPFLPVCTVLLYAPARARLGYLLLGLLGSQTGTGPRGGQVTGRPPQRLAVPGFGPGVDDREDWDDGRYDAETDEWPADWAAEPYEPEAKAEGYGSENRNGDSRSVPGGRFNKPPGRHAAH